jgi:AcrR family transcriptional regulator
MVRPSKKTERTEEILQAFQRCVARYGLEGSTLERIAEESGLQRSLVRHFVGNREDLVQLLAKRVIEQSEQQWASFIDYLPEQNVVEHLLDGLFNQPNSDAEFVLVIESLIFAAGREPHLKQKMQNWMQKFTDDINNILRRDFPNADSEALNAVCFGLISLYFNLDSLAPLGMEHIYRQSAREAAKRLVSTLLPGV